MKISFKGHSEAQREVELTQKQLEELFELVKYQFMSHIEFSSSFDTASRYQDPGDKIVYRICDAHNVDAEYKKDRMAFFEAVLSTMENPYK